MHPDADARAEHIEVVAVRHVLVVGREHRRALLVVAGVDDQVQRLLDPLGRPLGPQIVKHQQVRLHDLAENRRLGRPGHRVEAGTNVGQQRSGVVIDPPQSLSYDHAQDRHGQMRLADAWGTDEQQPPVHRGKRLGERFRPRDGPFQLFVRVPEEGVKPARRVAARDARVRQHVAGLGVVPAVAALGTADAVHLAQAPARAVAVGTGNILGGRHDGTSIPDDGRLDSRRGLLPSSRHVRASPASSASPAAHGRRRPRGRAQCRDAAPSRRRRARVPASRS